MSVAQSMSDSISYTDLYKRWEESNWSAYGIDFSRDTKGWQSLSDIQRRSAMWTYSMFFYGEDSVTDNLSPYIDAAPTEEQTYFLTTQQVDEARHSVFFHRFFSEVMGSGSDIDQTLASTLPQLGWGYRRVFSRLDRMAEELRKDRSLPRFAQAITLYHMVVEGALAQPGQHFIQDYFAKAGVMPGFSEGMENVSRDEQRHIGFGVKVLSELFAQSEECKAAAAELLREVSPYTVAVFVPPGWDREYTRCYGFELEDIFAFALRLMKTRWRAAGYPIEEMPPGVFPIDVDAPEQEVAARQIKLMEAGVLGEPGGKPESSPEVQELLFSTISRTVDTAGAGKRPMTIQWRFDDAEPWHLHVDNGATRVERGEDPSPDVTLESSWSDFVEVSIRGSNPAKAMLQRRLRPHGSLRQLARMRRLFPRRDPIR